MKRNIKSNRKKLAEESVDNMDLDAMVEYIRDQFEERYEELTPTEFNKQWGFAFGE